VRVTGGFTRSRFWMQLLADVLGRELRVPSVQEASALGAAALAMVGVGALASPADAGRFVTVGAPIEPDTRMGETYARTFDLYMRTYWALQEQFRDISAMQRAGG
jgi:gluconokinase